MKKHHSLRRYAASLGLAATPLLLFSALVGCTPGARLEITQPGRPAPLDHLDLHGRWAYFDTGAQGDRLLLATAHPGAQDGKRQYFVYLVLPPDAGKVRIGDPLADGASAECAGFFIQRSGTLAGRAEFVRGDLTVRSVPLSGGKIRTGKVVLLCDDGTVIDGRFTARRQPLELRTFEEETYPHDVAALRSAAPKQPGPS